MGCRRRNTDHHAIVELCRGLGSQPLPDDVWQFLALAKLHGLAGAIAAAILSQEAPLDIDTEDQARALVHGTLARHLVFTREALRVSEELSASQIPHAVVKGPILASIHHDHPSVRAYVDLDVLVAPTRLAEALMVLEAIGCELQARNWPLLASTVPAELPLATPSGVPLDLHWSLSVERAARHRRRLDTEGMLSRLRWVPVVGGALPTLDITDTLLHLCTHSADSGGDRLLWLYDIDSAVRAEQPDWSLVVDRSTDYRIRGPVALMMTRTARVFGTPVPERLNRDLGQRAWPRMATLVDAVVPPGTKYPRGSVGRSLARATREDPVRGAGELTRRGVNWARLGSGRRTWLGIPSHDSGSALFEGGGSLADYLRAMELEAGGGRMRSRWRKREP